MKALQNLKILYGTALLLLIAGFFYGCKDDFLVGEAQGSLDEQTLANQNGVEGNLIGTYRMLGGWAGFGGWGTGSSNWIFGSVTSDDAYKGSEPGDQGPITDVELYNWSTGGTDEYLNDKWASLYEGVNRANSTLRLMNRLLEDDPNAIPEADANSIRGEALFLRAYYHYDAWRMWENIPYYFEEDDDFRKSNENVDVIGNITNDLQQAISFLPESPRNGQVGRATSWTAQALLGRVQADARNYGDALTTLRAVRTSGVYDLEENFQQVWTGFSEYANGPETIIAYQASANDGNSEGDNSNYHIRLAYPHSGSPFGCCGFFQPSQNLVNFFVVDDDGLPLAMTDPAWDNRNDALAAGAGVPVDPRLDWTVGRDGVPFKDWGNHESGWIRDRGYGGPYSPKKHVHEASSGAESNVGWNATHLNSVNWHLYRYADLLLLLAEAEVEAGSLDNALEIVNEIRARAGVAAQGPGDSPDNIAVPIDHGSITWADYSIGLYDSFPDQDFARRAVRHERRLELAMEGHRFFDLKRWGVVEDVLNDYTNSENSRRSYLSAASNFEDRHQRFPIPSFQIDVSRVDGENRLIQNSGW
ncbi:RagB/SusD family nutrient uptake outer membrane protein [Rhodohalobacter sp. SW132]|uniref:RagB/SusD family nutrient uptake outer membrane protein n=1 Tax=Rhodohalobacter sp. SW132 TaxID=2293433 RepID=UPI000E2274F0|nr:RagB/SusD family nutrient uptake outer membrane protein [Rhodohalobacter sp. SW132]REL37855.1 RagB/SusD family nutrient uptake outer membrane protein [Rhodohalobacter sp. SW132]